jgi:hypothetical protein
MLFRVSFLSGPSVFGLTICIVFVGTLPTHAGVKSYYSFDDTLDDTASDYVFNSGLTDNHLSPVGGSGVTYVDGMVGRAIQMGTDPLYATAAQDVDFDLGGQYTI